MKSARPFIRRRSLSSYWQLPEKKWTKIRCMNIIARTLATQGATCRIKRTYKWLFHKLGYRLNVED